MYPADSHIGKCVVVTFNQYADTVGFVVADNIYIVYVAVRGSVIGSGFDMDTQRDIFDGSVAYDRCRLRFLWQSRYRR